MTSAHLDFWRPAQEAADREEVAAACEADSASDRTGPARPGAGRHLAVVLLAGAGALVVLPAMLALLGQHINALTVWRRSVRPPEAGFWFKTARRVMHRPVCVIVVAAVVLALMAAPFVHIRLGYLDDRVLAPSNQIRHVDDMVRADFGQGQTDALQVVVPHVGRATTAQQVAYAIDLSKLPDVQTVDGASGIYVDGTAVAAPANFLAQFSSGDGIWYSVVPKDNGLSPKGEDLVRAIRDGPAPFSILVGGTPASLVDSTSIISHDLPLAVLLVVGATLLILLLLFRTLFIAVKALVLSVISLSATFGAMVWVFQEGHLSRWLDFTPTGTLIDTMPILMFCVAFGLSMDYEVFLISRMKEFHDNGAPNGAAIAGGMQQTGRVITAAALLMSIIFLSLATSSVSFIKLFAVGLALAVLMDAFIIRGILVPAIMKLAGGLTWWSPPFHAPSGTTPAARRSTRPPSTKPVSVRTSRRRHLSALMLASSASGKALH